MGPDLFTRKWVVFHPKNRMSVFDDCSKELGPGTITIGTVLFWSWGFWDYRPDSVILRPKIGITLFENTTKTNFPVADPLFLAHPGKNTPFGRTPHSDPQVRGLLVSPIFQKFEMTIWSLRINESGR